VKTLPNDDEQKKIQPLIDLGWTLRARRSHTVSTKLSDEVIGEIARSRALLGVELRAKRQGKNARAAALNREKHEKQGVLEHYSGLVLAGHDELGRPLSVSDVAELGRRVADLQEKYDAFEAERKAELTGLREEIADDDATCTALSAKIRDGGGWTTTPAVVLAHYADGVVATFRLDSMIEVERRNLTEEERQGSLIEAIEGQVEIEADLQPLASGEYTLAISGRALDAARSYARRCGMTESAALKCIARLLPDEEMPPEEPEEEAPVVPGGFVVREVPDAGGWVPLDRERVTDGEIGEIRDLLRGRADQLEATDAGHVAEEPEDLIVDVVDDPEADEDTAAAVLAVEVDEILAAPPILPPDRTGDAWVAPETELFPEEKAPPKPKSDEAPPCFDLYLVGVKPKSKAKLTEALRLVRAEHPRGFTPRPLSSAGCRVEVDIIVDNRETEVLLVGELWQPEAERATAALTDAGGIIDCRVHVFGGGAT
jgi:hypothetical protein